MKNFYFLLLFCFSVSLFSQNKAQKLLSTLDKSDLQTGFLFNNLSSSSGITKDNKTNFNSYGFFQAYRELQQSDDQNRFKNYSELKAAEKQSYFDDIIPIGIVFAKFDIIKETAYQDGLLVVDSNQLRKVENTGTSIFETKQKLIAAPFRTTKKGLQTTFKISEAFFENLSDLNINHIKIDFDDSQKSRRVTIGETITIPYLTEGEKTLQFQVQLSNGDVLNSTSNITIKKNNAEINTTGIEARTGKQRIIQDIYSTILPELQAPYGETNYHGKGEYEIFLSPDNVLDKPIILVDGFDPSDTRDIAGIYSLLDFAGTNGAENLGDLVRNEGFDVVILNFPVYTRSEDNTIVDGGADFIERNAMILTALIDKMNTDKVGSEQNVIIGPSMGGIISRYALNYMEANSLDHDTRLWISFDSPHQGANVPLGVQHAFNYFAFGDYPVADLEPVVGGMLQSPAAKQMLTDHFTTHLQTGNITEFDPSKLTPEAHAWHTTLYNNMSALTASDYPENTRNVSIINGSGIGNPYQANNIGNNVDIMPGFNIIDTSISVLGIASASIDLNLTPAISQGSSPISDIDIVLFGFIPLGSSSANAQAHSYTDGIDAASGGLFDVPDLAAGFENDLLTDLLDALKTDYFNFIPSVSAMALANNGNVNWYEDINLGAGDTPWDATTTANPNTPFVNWYMPDENQPHVTLTQPNVDFAWEEIIDTNTLSTPNNTFAVDFIKLEQNPVSQSATILSSQVYKDANVSIVDVTGKIVLQSTLDLNQRTTIPFQMASGLYIINIESEGNPILRTKLLVK